jgi:hypothetical protein
VTPDEKIELAELLKYRTRSEFDIELAELLKYRTRSEFDIRSDRIRAAERRLGMWENGKFTGRGLTELIERARRHDNAAREGKANGDRFSQDAFPVLNFGFRNHQEIEDADCRRRGANLGTDGARSPAD